MKLYFLRHGETDWNVKRLAQGQVDIPLNDYGIYLAKETKKGFENTHIDLCISSPLSRAVQTAEIVLEGKDVPIITDKRLMELAFGDYEGICVSGPDKSPETDNFMKFFTDPKHFVPKGNGETLNDLINRCRDFLNDIINNKEYTDKNILISTHGGALRALLGVLENKSTLDEYVSNDVCPNCGVNVVEVSSNGDIKFIEKNKVFYKDKPRVWKVGE